MTSQPDTVPTRPRRLSAAVAILFGLFYAYDLFEALSNLISVPAQIGEYNEFLIENDLTALAVPWAILIANLLLPVAAFALAWWLGRRRKLLLQALLFLVGLALVAALSLTLTALV